MNATVYEVLSMVSSPPHENLSLEGEALDPRTAEGCYAGHLTLQALGLWRYSRTVQDAVAKVGTAVLFGFAKAIDMYVEYTSIMWWIIP